MLIFVLRRQPRNFENVTLVARRRKYFQIFLAIFWLLNSFQKEGLLVHKNSLTSFYGVVTASSHALSRVFSNQVIWVLGHCWVDTQHIHTFEGDSVLCRLIALHRHGHAEWLKLCQQKHFSWTGSVKIHRSRTILSIRSACAPDSRHTKPLQMVATRVVPAIALFYSARGIGSQASAGAAVDKELRRAGKTCCRRQNL